MRQEGSQSNSGNPQVNSAGSSGMLAETSSLSVQTMEDIHHHLRNQNSQTLAFSDIY